MASEHIVKSYDQELTALHENVVRLGRLAAEQLAAALECMVERDADRAEQVRAADKQLDDLEAQIDADVVRMLALRQPMARDLREIISALKMASDLERIGDYSKNIAKRTIALSQAPEVAPLSGVPRMGRMVIDIVHKVIDAYDQRDVDKAREAWEQDEEVDEIYNSLFRETLTYMMEDARNITPCTHVLFIAKNIERMGDHATNVAEMVHFLIEGSAITDKRPKSDATSFAVMDTDGDPA